MRNSSICTNYSDYDDEAVEEVYEEVSKAKEESKAEYTIVMGDVNAKIGKCQPGEETIMGKFGVGERNSGGGMLLEFATQQSLIITRRTETDTGHGRAQAGNFRNQIDFILVNEVL